MEKVVLVKCPDCGATLEIDEGKKVSFCSYCGAKVITYNDNEFVYHHIDEAKMRELDIMEREKKEAAEKEKLQRAQELQQEQNERQRDVIRKASMPVAFVVGILMVCGGIEATSLWLLTIGVILITIVIWKYNSNKKAKYMAVGYIKFPSTIGDNAYILKADLDAAGFTNVRMANLKDVTIGLLKRPGEIESVTVNGKTPSLGKWISPDTSIVIKYHGKSNESN